MTSDTKLDRIMETVSRIREDTACTRARLDAVINRQERHSGRLEKHEERIDGLSERQSGIRSKLAVIGGGSGIVATIWHFLKG